MLMYTLGWVQLPEPQRGVGVGAQYYACIMGEWNIAMGSVYPLSEHVDIFPVRLVSTFHRVFSVYLTLAIYPT